MHVYIFDGAELGVIKTHCSNIFFSYCSTKYHSEDMADTTGKHPVTDDFIAFNSFTDDAENVYSTVDMATMNRENIYTASTESKNNDDEDATTKNKKLISLAAILSIIILLMLITGGFIALFLELANLKSELSSFKQTLPSERAQQLNTSIDRTVQERLQDVVNQFSEQIYENFSTIDDQLTELDLHIHASVQVQEENQLNISTRLTELEDTENLQNNKIQQINASLAGLHPSFPATSCAALPPSSPSGYYWVRASNGSAVRVYCDMTRSCGGVTGGWVRVAELDMTNSSHQCPSGLRERNDSNNRTCVRDSDSPGCSSVTFSSATLEYSRVCGKIIAYQVGTTDAFVVTNGHGSNPSLNTFYVDGVSLTHGTPRQHIWTLAAAFNEENGLRSCPCTNSNTAHLTYTPPAFVRNDYFCDTGNADPTTPHNIFYGDDPLWDGAGCGPTNICCSFNNPPWFYKQLPQSTTDDTEMRVCRDEDASNEDIAIEMVEIYIQ